MARRTGRDVLLEVLASEGVVHIFGNPGTTELPLMDALVDRDDFHYVLAMQEATVVAMADGYAQATGRPAFVNVHTMAGLGNAIGNLTNAVANRTPLVVTAGNADRRHLIADPLLSGDLVKLAQGVSKWGHEVRHPEELGTVLRRAFNDAATAPGGPVFVALPQDLVDQECDDPVPPKSEVERRTIGTGLDRLAALLTAPAPGKLAIVAGEEVASSGAMDELVAVAERLGAPVFTSPLASLRVFPPAHPLSMGGLNPRADAIRGALTGYERIFLVGNHAFLVYPYAPGSPMPDDADLVQLAPDPYALGRTHPVRLGVAGDPRLTLGALLPLLPETPAAGSALDTAKKARAAQIASFEETALSRYDASPMHPMAAVHATLRGLPPDTTVVDEGITAGAYVRGLHLNEEPGSYFFCRGGGLGWGMPAACGISLARGGEPVLCIVGDGSAMYSPQALWTAAHEQLPVVFAVVNNRQYLILKQNLQLLEGKFVETGRSVGMDLDQPPVDFVSLAHSMGVAATFVDRAADVGDAVRAAHAAGKPHLLELPVSPV
jgi:benzoylformate decarboxylase